MTTYLRGLAMLAVPVLAFLLIRGFRYLARLRGRQKLVAFPEWTPMKIGNAVTVGSYRGSPQLETEGDLVFGGEARGALLDAPLSGKKTLGFLLELHTPKCAVPMAAGHVGAMSVDDGSGTIHLAEGPAMLLVDAPVSASAPLAVHLTNPLIRALFAQRGIDLYWAERQSPLELRERCLPSDTRLWVAGRPAISANRLSLDGAVDERWVSTFDLGAEEALSKNERVRSQLIAQRQDELVDRIIPVVDKDTRYIGP